MTGSELSALFTCASSPYLVLGIDCYDRKRDARTFQGSGLVICHPPCRSWGRYAHRSKHQVAEKDLALWALELVRRNGGVLEHPASSSLWKHLRPGETSFLIRQADFGHRAEKLTRLFYSGLPKVPLLPDPALGPFHPVERMGRQERERTPVRLAEWLVTWCQAPPVKTDLLTGGHPVPLVQVCN